MEKNKISLYTWNADLVNVADPSGVLKDVRIEIESALVQDAICALANKYRDFRVTRICIVGPLPDASLNLRARALKLLREAEAIDGLKPFTILHEHRFGKTEYLAWSKESPNKEQAALVLEEKFEPDTEGLTVMDSPTLADLVGLSESRRIPDLAARLPRGPGAGCKQRKI